MSVFLHSVHDSVSDVDIPNCVVVVLLCTRDITDRVVLFIFLLFQCSIIVVFILPIILDVYAWLLLRWIVLQVSLFIELLNEHLQQIFLQNSLHHFHMDSSRIQHRLDFRHSKLLYLEWTKRKLWKGHLLFFLNSRSCHVMHAICWMAIAPMALSIPIVTSITLMPHGGSWVLLHPVVLLLVLLVLLLLVLLLLLLLLLLVLLPLLLVLLLLLLMLTRLHCLPLLLSMLDPLDSL